MTEVFIFMVPVLTAVMMSEDFNIPWQSIITVSVNLATILGVVLRFQAKIESKQRDEKAWRDRVNAQLTTMSSEIGTKADQIAYVRIETLLTEVIQEQRHHTEELVNEMKTLSTKVTRLEAFSERDREA